MDLERERRMQRWRCGFVVVVAVVAVGTDDGTPPYCPPSHPSDRAVSAMKRVGADRQGGGWNDDVLTAQHDSGRWGDEDRSVGG